MNRTPKFRSLGLVLAQAETKTAKTAVSKKSAYFAPVPEEFAALSTDVSYESLKAQAKEYQNRKIAQEPDLSDKSMSKEYVAYRDRILNLKDAPELKKYNGGRYATWSKEAKEAQALDDIMAELDDDAAFAKFPSDLKVMAYGVPVARAMKSVIYRVRSWISENPSVHSPMLSFVRQAMTGAGVYLPTVQAAAVGAYITEPMDKMGPVFEKSDDFAKFIADDLTMAFRRTLRRLKLVEFDHILIVDNQLMYSSASFQDGLQRYQVIGVPEMNMMYAGVYGVLAQLSAINAYDYADILDVAKKTGVLYGVDAGKGMLKGMFGGNDDGEALEGAPMRDRVKAVRHFTNFMTLKGARGSKERKDAESWMKYAFAFSRRSAERSLAAWQVLKGRSASETAVINPGFVTPVNRWATLGEPTSLAILNGPTAVKSAVTNEAITVNLPLLFNEPPEDLKSFLPSFATGESKKASPKTVSIGGKDVVYDNLRNYREGAAQSWDYGLYGKYFTSADGKGISSPADIKRAARILSQTWGVGGPALAGALL
jgi:hypothetical protein